MILYVYPGLYNYHDEFVVIYIEKSGDRIVQHMKKFPVKHDAEVCYMNVNRPLTSVR